MNRDKFMINFFPFAVFFSSACLTLSLFLGMYQLLTGPTLPDRIVVLDLVASLVMGLIIVYAAKTGETVYLNAVVVIALLSYMSNIAFAKYLRRQIDD
ncbi:multiple resistance and pH homeostasis system, subunit F [Waddlia chondrophila WSU 86-1044]|uniref:Multiple resistance and pH homeostasis system, subunit F n=2 Tax=Waddlia chondrophila TaxID=71667 RepID=D6YRH6_WADCW|nr:multiple resistance and pH homeostasis system, subunit F [Waddlia chondrophila WSU 86-1044]